MKLIKTAIGLLQKQSYPVLLKFFFIKTLASAHVLGAVFSIKNCNTKYADTKYKNFKQNNHPNTDKSTDFRDVNGSLTNYSDNTILDTHKHNVQTPAVAGVNRANRDNNGMCVAAYNRISWTNMVADVILTKIKTALERGENYFRYTPLRPVLYNGPYRKDNKEW